MKKFLLTSALAVLTLAALAQAPAQTPEQPRAEKTHVKRVKPAKTEHAEDGDNTGGVAVANHGQDVSAVAGGTALTGADKGAAISAVARTKRNGSNNAADVARAPQRSARGRSTTGGHAHASASSHGATHRATAGHRGH